MNSYNAYMVVAATLSCSLPVLIVDLVSKAWCVNDCQLHSYALLLNVCKQKHIRTLRASTAANCCNTDKQ